MHKMTCESDSLFSNRKYILINTGYNYSMHILWLPRCDIAQGCLPGTPNQLNKIQFVNPYKVTVKQFCYPKIGLATCFSIW